MVELKKGRASDAVVGQTLRYMSYVQESWPKKDQTVHGIIVALEDDQRIRRALTMAPKHLFYRYQVSFKLVAHKMNNIGQPERVTQNRVIALFRDELDYRYLGDWIDRDGNSNIEEDILSAYLTASGYTSAQISRGPLQAAHRSRQPQPQPLWKQPSRLQSSSLRRAGKDRGR